MSETLKTITELLEAKKGPVVAIAQWPHEKDAHMFHAVVEIRTGEFAVWNVNGQVARMYGDCGCSDGSYFTLPNNRQFNMSDALGEFECRVNRRRL